MRRPIYFTIGILIGMALAIAVSCTPNEIAAFRTLSPADQQRVAEAVAREQHADIADHPTLRCIRAHESDTAGGYAAQNPTSSASGAYQYIDSTWRSVSRRAGHPGYSRAVYAPAHIQDAVALWHVNNLGTSAWAGSGCN